MAFKSKRNPYDPQSRESFRISRSKIELFLNCPRCFYLDLRLGISQPPGFPFNLNLAVDLLLKNEFDYYRKHGTNHPLLEKLQIDAYPVSHPQLNDWRNTFVGIEFLHTPTNFLVFGGIDDLWRNSHNEYIVVDYKATSSKYPITSYDRPWHITYKRQIEVYQWLLRQNGLKVSPTGYFFHCNGDRNREFFDAKMHFDINIIPYEGNTEWVEQTLFAIYECLRQNEIPRAGESCRFCEYTNKIQRIWFTPDAE